MGFFALPRLPLDGLDDLAGFGRTCAREWDSGRAEMLVSVWKSTEQAYRLAVVFSAPRADETDAMPQTAAGLAAS
jgi:hypothetical protein